MSNSILLVRIVLFLLSLALLTPLSTAQEREPAEDYGPLFKVLAQSKHSLADGIRQTTKSTEVPISAKFELDDNGKLSQGHFEPAGSHKRARRLAFVLQRAEAPVNFGHHHPHLRRHDRRAHDLIRD